MIPSLLASIIPASMVVFMGLRLPPAAKGIVAPPAGLVGDSIAPRFSRLAILGAVWAPLVFVALGTTYVGSYAPPGSEQQKPAWLLMFLAFPLLLLGAAAPFGTTILGLLACSQIRRSAGRLRGLGLAVFDVLLFPLLVLDGVIVWAFLRAARLLTDYFANPALARRPDIDPAFTTKLANLLADHPGVAVSAAVVVLLVADFLIIGHVWRAMCRPTASSDAAVPSASRAADGPGQPRSTRWRNAWTTVLLAVAIAILLRLFLLDSYLITGSPVEPELTAGSRILVWKPARTFAPGDIVAYDREGKTFVARVVSATAAAVTVNRNGQADESVSRSRLEGKVISVLWRAPSQATQGSVRSRFPGGAHIGGNDHSVLLKHDNVDAHYVFYHAGDFNSSSSGSQNEATRSWTDEGAIKLKNGRTFGYRRIALYPDELTVNGAQYDLGKGRVFVLRDDGTPEQLSVPVSLSVARDPVAMGALLREQGGKTNGAAASPTVEKSKSASVTLLLLGTDEKPMPRTKLAFMEIGGTVSKIKPRGQIASGETDDLGFVHTFSAPPDRAWEIAVLRDGAEIMRSASIRTPASANSPMGAPNYLLELRASDDAKLNALLTPLSVEANQAARGAAPDQVIAARLAMATMLQRLQNIPADSAERGAAFLPVPGAVVPVTKRVEVAGQIDRLLRQIRSDGEAGTDAPSQGSPSSSAESPKPAASAPPAQAAAAGAPLIRREVKEKTPDGKDVAMTFEELRRDEKTSTATVKSVGGGSVASAMFITRGAYEIAKARGAAYFLNLKEWEAEAGQRMYLIGFAPDRNVDPKTYFDLKEPLPADKRLLFLSTALYDRVFQKQQ